MKLLTDPIMDRIKDRILEHIQNNTQNPGADLIWTFGLGDINIWRLIWVEIKEKL